MTLKFSRREKHLIFLALRIATEDESIYGGAGTLAERKRINAEIEEIERKLDTSTE